MYLKINLNFKVKENCSVITTPYMPDRYALFPFDPLVADTRLPRVIKFYFSPCQHLTERAREINLARINWPMHRRRWPSSRI